MYQSAVCPDCNNAIIRLVELQWLGDEQRFVRRRRFLAYPQSLANSNIEVDTAVPDRYRLDYIEAHEVLGISTKASAALSRRVLQSILLDQGYESTNLYQQIGLVLAEKDTSKILPSHIRNTIDAVRNFGNFAAHPITELSSLQVIDVEPEEAEWCLEIIDALFDHYYVTPSRALEKRAKLDEKLAKAGKKPART